MIPDRFLLLRPNPEAPVGITNWHFNAWAKYPDWQLDDQLPSKAAELQGCRAGHPCLPSTIAWSWSGRIDVNGRGTLITTEECLLSPVQQRNPGLTRADLSSSCTTISALTRCCGWIAASPGMTRTATWTTSLVWLIRCHRHRHGPGSSRRNHLPLAENLERLHAARDPEGRPFNIVELPMPSPVVFQGQRLPASYANFYIANGLVLVPTFNDANDRKALNLLADLFPGRQVVGIHCGDLIWGLGTLHCITGGGRRGDDRRRSTDPGPGRPPPRVRRARSQ